MQAAGPEGIPRPGGLNGFLLQEWCRLHAQILIVSPAPLPSHGEQDQRDIVLTSEPSDSGIEILLPGKPLDLVVRDLENIALREAVCRLLLRLLQRFPQRGPQVRVKGDQRAVLLCRGDGLLRGSSHLLVGHGQSSEMKEPCVRKKLQMQLLLPQHHIRTGIAVEGKVPVTVRKGLHKGQRSPHIRIRHQIGGVNSHLVQNRPQTVSENILPYLSDKGGLPPRPVQHGQHVAGRTARVCLIKRIALCAHPVFRKINQQFSQRCHVEFFHLHQSPKSYFTRSMQTSPSAKKEIPLAA